MPRNGSGVYSLPATYNPVISGTVIDPTAFNSTMADLATAMSGSIASDGETPVTGNLPMAGFKHTAAGAPNAAGQYLVFGSAATVTTLTATAGIVISAPVGSDTNLSTGIAGAETVSIGFNGTGSTNGGGVPAGAAYITVSNGTLNPILVFTTTNIERIRIDTSGRFSGTALHNNSVSPTGTTQQYVASGTYTPTLTAITAVGGLAVNGNFKWIRVGNVVQVVGQITAVPTSAAQVNIGIALPLASNLAAITDLAGQCVGNPPNNINGWIVGDTTNKRAIAEYSSINTGSQTVTVGFSYEVL